MNRYCPERGFLVGALLCAMACWSVALAEAASIDLQLEYVETYDSSFTPLGQTFDLPCPMCGDGDYLRFNVWMQLDDLGPNEDFAYVSFNVDSASSSMLPASFLGGSPWVGNNPIVDFNGPSPPDGMPLFAQNHDLGFSDEDLMEITVVGDAAKMALAQLGEAGQHPAVGSSGPAFLLGSFWLQTTGVNSITNSGSIAVLPNVTATQAWGTYVDGVLTPQSQGFHGGEIVWICPEPTSVTLASLAVLGMLGLVRRRAVTFRAPY